MIEIIGFFIKFIKKIYIIQNINKKNCYKNIHLKKKMSEIPTSLILSQIIKPEYQKYFSDWVTTSNEKEARGLQLIGAVYKHKCRKKFRAKPPSVQLKTLHEQNEFEYQKRNLIY